MKSGQSEESFLNDSRNKDLNLGDTWYVISSTWFDRYFKALKYDSDKPGPIDNSDILQCPEISEVKDELLENIDFVFVPEECWTFLTEKYGTVDNVTAIGRQVFEFGDFTRQLKIDLSGVKINLEYQGREVRQLLGKGDTIGQLRILARNVFKLDDREYRVWLKRLPNNFVQLKCEEDLLHSIYADELLDCVVETKLENGTWSEKYSSSEKLLSTFEKNSSTVFGSSTTRYSSNNGGGGDLNMATRSMVQSALTRNSNSGLVGLNNLGNTCFMASALQCLSNIPELTQFFISDDYEQEINEKNPIGNKGDLARAYGDLLKQLWCGTSSSVAPRYFKSVLGRCAPQFSGYMQQDSQELMAFLLDGLHEDLNRITNKPYINQDDGHENTADRVAAQQAWDNHKKRNDSIITDLFHGQYRSRLDCPDCNKISKIFDPFMYLSVSVPRKEEKVREIDIIWLDPDRARTRYRVVTPREGQVLDLLYAMEKVSGLETSRMMLCEMSQSIIESTVPSTHKLRDIREGRYWLCIFEREPKQSVIKVYHAYKGYTSYLKFFGNPLVMQVGGTMSYNDFIVSLYMRMKRYVKLTESSIADVDSLPFAVKVVNQFGVEQSHSLCDENGNLNVTMASGKQVQYLSLVWDINTRDEYFDTNICNTIEHHESHKGTKARRNEISLDDCIEQYCKEEILNEDNMWYCPHCKAFKQATKKLDLWRLPKVLVIHLKRFSYSRQWRDKIETLVKFPLRDLSLSRHLQSEAEDDIRYELRGVVNHYGGLGGGHYTATCLSAGDEKWHVFDDSHVSSCSADKSISPSAYVLFYTRQESETNGFSNGDRPMDVD